MDYKKALDTASLHGGVLDGSYYREDYDDWVFFSNGYCLGMAAQFEGIDGQEWVAFNTLNFKGINEMGNLDFLQGGFPTADDVYEHLWFRANDPMHCAFEALPGETL